MSEDELGKYESDLNNVAALIQLANQVVALQSRIKEVSKTEQEKPVTFWYLNEYIYPLLRDLIALLIKVIGDS